MFAALTLFTISAVTCHGETLSERDRAEFVAWAKTHAVPLQTNENQNNSEDLRAFKRIVGTAHYGDYQIVIPGVAFDAIVYIYKLSPSHPVPPQ